MVLCQSHGAVLSSDHCHAISSFLMCSLLSSSCMEMGDPFTAVDFVEHLPLRYFFSQITVELVPQGTWFFYLWLPNQCNGHQDKVPKI